MRGARTTVIPTETVKKPADEERKVIEKVAKIIASSTEKCRIILNPYIPMNRFLIAERDYGQAVLAFLMTYDYQRSGYAGMDRIFTVRSLLERASDELVKEAISLRLDVLGRLKRDGDDTPLQYIEQINIIGFENSIKRVQAEMSQS